jgi:hypothetical protein
MNCIDQYHGDGFSLYNGDSCEVIKGIPDNSVGLSVFSPPFSSLFVYSESESDMGNCISDDEFFAHYKFLLPELLRVTIPGRLCAVHCSDLPAHMCKEGWIGLKDFSGDLIRAHTECGWIYHSRVTIWKDPVVEMQRTKSLGLLHKQVCKDSTRSRQGIPDTLLVFRKDGGEQPVAGELDPSQYAGEAPRGPMKTSIDVWQNYASPVWFDIRQGNTLNVRVARSDKDERHICPLQLDLIDRCIQLWSNPGDVVFSPFGGIGSEPYSAILRDRFGLAIELKPQYYQTAIKNCESAVAKRQQGTLWPFVAVEPSMETA